MRHGPNNDDEREWELKSGMTLAYSDPQGKDLPLFQARCAQIKADREKFGKVEFSAVEGDSVEEKVYSAQPLAHAGTTSLPCAAAG